MDSNILLRKLIRMRREEDGEDEGDSNAGEESATTVATSTMSNLEKSKEQLKNVQQMIGTVSTKMHSMYFIL